MTALAALKVLLGSRQLPSAAADGVRNAVWPGRFQRVGGFIVDGAHNPPAARALVSSLATLDPHPPSLDLVCGFCGDKDVGEVLSVLAPVVKRGYAVRTNNPRSLSAEETAAKMRAAGIDVVACDSLRTAIGRSGRADGLTLVCGSLFLAGEALVELDAYPWGKSRFDPAEVLKI